MEFNGNQLNVKLYIIFSTGKVVIQYRYNCEDNLIANVHELKSMCESNNVFIDLFRVYQLLYAFKITCPKNVF